MSNQSKLKDRSTGGHMLYGSAWMIGLRWGLRVTGFFSTIILARLLVPADFGIVAMAMVFVGLLEQLNQTGQKLLIIRHPNPARQDYDTAWTISVVVGLSIALTVFLLAPVVGIYFHEPRAVSVARWLALRAAMGGFENIGVIDFRRDIRFDRFFLYNMYPKLISFGVTVTLAILWRNYWALVAGIICLQAVTIVTSYVMHPYRPGISFSKIGEMWSFSGWTLFRTIGTYLNSQVDQIAVGGVFGSAIMGRYAVAADVAASPIEEINGPMVSVLYPVMSSVQNDVMRLRELYLATLQWSAIICAAAGVGVSLVAHDMIALVLGQKWMAAEPFVVWLALSAALLGLSSGAYTTFDSLGKPHLGARLQWVRLTFLIVCIVPTALILRDPVRVALVRMVVTAAFVPTLFFAIGREVRVSGADFLRALWRPLIAAGCMALVVLPLNAAMSPGNLRLAVAVSLGAITFVAASFLLWQASGRPVGPEADVVLALRNLRMRFAGNSPTPG